MSVTTQTHYHFHYRKFSRADGKSAVEAAAYRYAAKLHDERTGENHNYTFKRGVTDTMVITPLGQPVPDWVHDPQRLWNEAESAEKNNPRALVMHELEIAIPHQLTHEQRKEAARHMAIFITKRYGCVAHLAFHEPNREGDQRNHHVHLMFTTRAITETGFAKNKFRHFSRREAEARDTGELTGAEEIKLIRKQWALIGNRHLQMAGHKPTLDHRSYEDQGLDLEPQKHLGPDATAKERRGERTAKGDFNRAVMDRNHNRLAWAQAWEQARIDITGKSLPEPPARPQKPFADITDPKRHEDQPREFSKAFQTLMANQTTERTSIINLHITERKALWREQQELQKSHKKQWALLYRRQREEREAFDRKHGAWSRRLFRKLDFLGRLSKAHRAAMEAMERHQKIERARLGRHHRAALQVPVHRLATKHERDLVDVDTRHREQRQEFLAREFRNRELLDRLKKQSRPRDRDRDPGRGR